MSLWLSVKPEKPPLSSPLIELMNPSCSSQVTVWSPSQNSVAWAGLRVNPEAPEVSISKARTRMQEAIQTGNYQMALEWCAMVLARYPSHPETMRAKGSILLLLGERDKAIEVYEEVEEIESDPIVRKKLEELQSQDQ